MMVIMITVMKMVVIMMMMMIGKMVALMRDFNYCNTLKCLSPSNRYFQNQLYAH